MLQTDTKSQTVDIWFVYTLPFSFKKLKKETKKEHFTDKKEHRIFSFEIEQYQNWKQGIYKHLACYWKQILTVLVWMSWGRTGGLLYDTSLETNSFYPFRSFSKQNKIMGFSSPLWDSFIQLGVLGPGGIITLQRNSGAVINRADRQYSSVHLSLYISCEMFPTDCDKSFH